jgi:hypothetical protein
MHPGDEHREKLALHGGVGTRPIRELHVLIEHLEAPPKVRKRQLELPLAVQRHAERHVRPDETGRIVNTGLEGTANSVAIAGRDRWFESTSLHRRVCKLPVPLETNGRLAAYELPHMQKRLNPRGR